MVHDLAIGSRLLPALAALLLALPAHAAAPAATTVAVPADPSGAPQLVAVPDGFTLRADAGDAARVTIGSPAGLHGVRVVPVTVQPAADPARVPRRSR